VSAQKYNLAIYSPVGDDGRYDDTVPDWLAGQNVLEVDETVNKKLKEKGLLFAEDKIVHSYPHCWRSKMPVIFRATEQWFIDVDTPLPPAGSTGVTAPVPAQPQVQAGASGGRKGGEVSLRDLSLERVKDVKWIPAWGEKRIAGMLESRPDWCISRQRSWGLPIPAFINSAGQTLMSRESVLAVAKHIAKHGSDSWFTDSPREILGQDFELPDGFDFEDLQKEENIFDVWFESGCSWYSVCVKEAGWGVPVDLYLEGSDQHRGWFQLSLLPALGAMGKEPFKSVLTHGFTVDEKGMKQSKSLGNYVNAQEEVAKYGSDILRLWVASVNYQEDIRCTDELIGRTQDTYRKIRNTLRYLLGNIYDFDPEEKSMAYDDMFEIDKWAMQQAQKLIGKVRQAYENFVFHRVFSLIYNFCTGQMSSIYMDVLKDRMYCEAADSISRRSGQTAMYRILDCLVRMLAPILAHTAEEVFNIQKSEVRGQKSVESVHLAEMPEVDNSIDWQSQEARWQKIMGLRDEVLRVLEGLRQKQEIASNQEASVTIYCDDEDAAVLADFGLEQFAALCIVSEVKLQKGRGETEVVAARSDYQKCQRCWNYWPSVGTDNEYPDLCKRCVEVVKTINR
jgi:isoleucyl-tRNA synthetase